MSRSNSGESSGVSPSHNPPPHPVFFTFFRSAIAPTLRLSRYTRMRRASHAVHDEVSATFRPGRRFAIPTHSS